MTTRRKVPGSLTGKHFYDHHAHDVLDRTTAIRREHPGLVIPVLPASRVDRMEVVMAFVGNERTRSAAWASRP